MVRDGDRSEDGDRAGDEVKVGVTNADRDGEEQQWGQSWLLSMPCTLSSCGAGAQLQGHPWGLPKLQRPPAPGVQDIFMRVGFQAKLPQPRWWCCPALPSQCCHLLSPAATCSPWPKRAMRYTSSAPRKPSIRHTTSPSFLSQPSSHTVPQRRSWKTSTRPSWGPEPLANRINPSSAAAAGDRGDVRGHGGTRRDTGVMGGLVGHHRAMWCWRCPTVVVTKATPMAHHRP